MRDDSSQNDPKEIWQNQPTEPSAMTMEKIRQKARELHAKTHRELLGNLAMPLIVITFSGFGIARTDDPWQRMAFALAILWSLTGQYFLNRGMWARTPLGDATFTTGLEFYRQEIKRRRNLFGRILQWSFGPVVFAIGALILAIGIGNRDLFRKMAPFTALVVVWIAGVFVVRMRGQRELQREIEELNKIEKQNR